MLLLFFLFFQVSSPTPEEAPADSVTQDVVFYGARRAIFLAREDRVVLLDSAWVRYRDMSVYSDSINYSIKNHLLSAYGNVLFSTATEEVTGTELHYNVDTRKGMMKNARSEVENGYLYAKEVWLVKERVLNARSADYTTCDLAHPHYTFFGPRVKLFMDDIAVTQPVVLRIWRIPVLAAPFWLVPVASKRKSGLMPFKVGNSNDQGYYAKGISYYWVINDYADATFFLDIMTRRGVQLRTEAVYIVEPYSKGSFQGAYIRETWNPAAPKTTRYSFNFANTSKLSPLTDLDLQAELLSDTAYAPEYAEDRLDWLKQEVYSYGALSHRFKKIGKASLRAERHIYYMRHYHYTALPLASFSFATRTLPGNWNISPNIGFSRRLEQADSLGIDTLSSHRLIPTLSFSLTSPDYSFGRLNIDENIRFAESRIRYRGQPLRLSRSISHDFNLGTSQKLFGIFNTSEGITFTQTDILTDTLPLQPQLNLNLNSSFSLYRVFGFSTPNLHGLLHTITPTIGLNYEPEITPQGLFGKINILKPADASIYFTVNNGFQAKVGASKQKIDLGTVNLATSYNPINHKVTPIALNLSTRPLAVLPLTDTGRVKNRLDLWVDGKISFQPDSFRFGQDYATITTFSFSHTLTDTLRQERGVEIRLNHTWGKNQNMLTSSATLYFPGWQLTLTSLGYNFIQKQLTDYQVSIWRDLHCWEAIVNLSGLGKEWRYDFEVRIKKLPDVRFSKSTFRTFLP